MDVRHGSSNNMGTFVIITLLGLILAPSLAPVSSIMTRPAQAGTLDWGSVKEITDLNDMHTDNIGNPVGYLDSSPVTAIHNGRLYVAWETSERQKGGSMIYVRSMRNEIWGGIKAVAGVEDGIIDTEPSLAEFNEDLYLAWSHTGGDDTEIYCRVLSLGEWSDCGEISGSDDYGMDSAPVLMVYDGQLWCAWVTRSVVTGRDSGGGDIVLRSYDGQEWGSKISIVNPTPANGYDDQPRLITYNDKLIIAWVTRDQRNLNATGIDLVFREFDGTSWGAIKTVGAPDGKDGSDTFPTLAVFNGKLFFVFQSEGESDFETDIHVASWDGTKVSAETSLTPANEKAADEHPVAEVFNEKIFVAWNSNDPNYTDGGDDDIAIAFFDGASWSAPEEVTPPDMEKGDHASIGAQDRFPNMQSYKGGLYVMWEQDDQRTAAIDAGDLKYRRYPPEGSGTDYTMVTLVLIVIILVAIFLGAWAFGPTKGKRAKRYIERKERETMHEKAISRAGGRTRGGRKRKGRNKRR